MSSVLLAASFFAGTARAEVCIADEDCDNLGYTEDKACTDGLKCPFGEKWHCPDKKCQIGWILNSDMSCTENVESGKTPIAVVVYMDDKGNGQAMTASPTAQSIVWSIEEKATGVPQFPNYKDAWNDFGSCSNTVKAMMNGDSQKYPAPWSAKTYAPSAAASTKGQWCLPAAGILHSTYENRKIIDTAIQKLGGEVLQNNRNQIWSSTESDKTFMHIFTVYSEGSGLSLRGKGQSSATVVRPVIEFNVDTGAAACKKLPDETGCTYGTTTGDDSCGGTRTVCKTCTPTCANSPRWCQSSSYELVETGKDQCGNVCRQCCTTYTDTITDSYCFYGTDSSTQLKHCSSFSTSDNKNWILAVPTKRTYSDGTVKNLKSCVAPSFSTEEMCNFKKRAYPIGSSTQHQDCRGY